MKTYLAHYSFMFYSLPRDIFFLVTSAVHPAYIRDQMDALFAERFRERFPGGFNLGDPKNVAAVQEEYGLIRNFAAIDSLPAYQIECKKKRVEVDTYVATPVAFAGLSIPKNR